MKYANYKANLRVLKEAPQQDLENEFVLSGIVDKFTMQFELAWKLLQKTLEYEGSREASTGSPRGIIKAAYSTYDFIDEDVWLRMLEDRNVAEHVYDEAMAKRLVEDINGKYISVFENLLERIKSLYPLELLDTF